MIEVKVPQSFIQRGIDSMEDEIERIDNVLESFEENGLEDTDSYYELKAKKEDLEIGVEDMREELAKDKEDKGIEELFG